MTSLQVAYALLRRMVFGSPRLRLASAAGPLVDNYELDCLPLSQSTKRWPPYPLPPLKSRTATSSSITTTLPHNTNWHGQVCMPHNGTFQKYKTTIHTYDVLVTSPETVRANNNNHGHEPLDEQIECIILSPEETYRLEPVMRESETTTKPPPVPIWADTVHHRPGI